MVLLVVLSHVILLGLEDLKLVALEIIYLVSKGLMEKVKL